jgi:RNA polymerase sigma-70 factor (ECF subfamily)
LCPVYALRDLFFGGVLMIFQNPNPNRFGSNVTTAKKIFDEYGDFIMKIIHSQVRDKELADDIFQDFFLSLISKPLPGDIQNIEAYLYTMITHDIIDTIRLAKIYEDYIYEYAERSTHSCNEETPEKLIIEEDEANRVFELIKQRLPQTEAQAICLQYQEDMSTQKIAEIMSIRSKTVRGYVSEGFSKIRRLLKDMETRTAD